MTILPDVTEPWKVRIERRHTPRVARRAGGYEDYRGCLRWEFRFHCAFCLCHEADLWREAEKGTKGTSTFSIEHFVTVEADPDCNPHLKWAFAVRRHIHAIQSIFANEPSRTITKDLESILRAATYSITDRRVFGKPPQNERDVHLRLEAVLKCVFPGLKHKPTLSKPIKNFEPDTGIASIQTLIEYKYLSSADAVPQIADELLADTRGYTSREWTSFVYVIYETKRFRPESEWRQLLRDCGVDTRTLVVVLYGEPADELKPPKRAKGSAAKKTPDPPAGRPRRL